MLIILPDHLRVSGITTWAMRAVQGLGAQSIDAGLVVHTAPGESVPEFLEPFVVSVLENAPSIHSLHGDLDVLVDHYLGVIKERYAQTGKPVIVSPNLHGDCYGAIATIAARYPEMIRVVSWIHSDNEYDIALCRRYEPMIHAFVPVSKELETMAKRSLPHRVSDIVHIPYPVDVDATCPTREPTTGRTLRLVYTGRLEEVQKRVSALPLLARQLVDRGLDFEFRVVGDGVEMESLIEQTKDIEQIHFFGAVPPTEIPEHLQWADLWILPSRYEGQSVAMLEALAHGCIPIVTQVRSGANDAVQHGETGFLVESEWNTPIETIAQRMVDSIEAARDHDTPQMALKAHKHALAHHSIPVHVQAVKSLIGRVQAMPARPWPQEIRASYSAPKGEFDGSTPADACDRIAKVLNDLAGKRVVIYCSGQHTRDVSKAIQESPAKIVGIVDDDPTKAGMGLIGYPIYSFDELPNLNATDLVISSWIYEESIWEKRDQFESLGLRVHRLYPITQAQPVTSS